MAGDWIKMRGNLWDDPRVGRLVDMTDTSEAAVVGGLYWLWSTADQHTEDGVMPGLSLKQIDRKTGIPGLGQALCDIGWLADHPEGVRIIKFEEHNGQSAKRRASDAQRKANVRNVSASEADNERTDGDDSQTDCGAREREEKEKRREEEKAKAKASAAPKPRKPAKTPLPADFSISPAVEQWAATKGYDRLAEHFDSFIRKAKANGYTYADWDQALQNAIADDWAKLRNVQSARASPSGPGQLGKAGQATAAAAQRFLENSDA